MTESHGEYLYRMDEIAKEAKSSQVFKEGDKAIVSDINSEFYGKECRIVRSHCTAGSKSVLHTAAIGGTTLYIRDCMLSPVCLSK